MLQHPIATVRTLDGRAFRVYGVAGSKVMLEKVRESGRRTGKWMLEFDVNELMSAIRGAVGVAGMTGGKQKSPAEAGPFAA